MSARPDRGEGFGRGEIARHRDEAGFDGRRDHRHVGVGRNDQPAARLGDRGHLVREQHGAGADQGPPLQPPRQPGDRFIGLRRIQRHLDDGETGLDQRLTDLVGVAGGEAAQDRDQGAARESGGEVGGGHKRLQIATMPATKAAWLSTSTALPPTAATAAR